VLVTLILVGCPKERSLFERALTSDSEFVRHAQSVQGELRMSCDHRDAEVYIDGVLHGSCQDLEETAGLRLPSGPHLVEVRKAGFLPYRAQVLTGDVRTSLEVNLLPMN
jgi:hypothetical protein